MPNVLLNGKKNLATLGLKATSTGRALAPILSQTGPRIAVHWSHLVGVTSRLIPLSSARATVPTKPATSPEPVAEAQA